MKVTIQNLGAIQYAELDLKPLTILIGPNNAGKTWMAYTLAGIFGYYGWGKYAEAYTEGKLSEKYPLLDNAIENVFKNGSAKIDLSEFAEQYGEQYFQNVANYAQQWMPDFMSTQFAAFDKMKVSVNTTSSKGALLEHIKKSTVNLTIAGGSFKVSKKRGNSTLYAYTRTENNEAITEKIPDEEIKERLVYSVMQVLHQSLYSLAVIFPTERTDLITFQFGRSANKSVLLDEKVREIFESAWEALQQLRDSSEEYFSEIFSQEPPRMAIGPVGSFLSVLTSLFNIGSKEVNRRERAAKSDPKIQKYVHLAQLLEDEILNGGLAFSTPEPEPRRDILFSPAQGATLEIPIASSMVKELAPLALYLRYLARPDELLVIDEPEMNLHPEAQVKMIEFLAMLANAGLRLLITTHSPYLLDHLSNLIHAAQYETEEQRSLAGIFFLQDWEAFISQDKVSVYCVQNGTAENILQENGRINWSTFGSITDQIANIHYTM